MVHLTSSLVYLSPVSCVHDYDSENIVLDPIYQTIIANAEPEMSCFTFHLFYIAFNIRFCWSAGCFLMNFAAGFSMMIL